MCINQDSPEKRTSRTCVCRKRERQRNKGRGWERFVMEAKKSHDWSPATWRPRKAGGIIQPEFKASESGEPMVYFPAWGQEEITRDVLVQSVRQKKRVNSSFLCLFVLFRSPVDWMMPPTFGRAIYFTESIDSNSSLIQKHSHRHTPK